MDQKKRYASNPESHRERARKYRRENVVKVRSARQRWHRENYVRKKPVVELIHTDGSSRQCTSCKQEKKLEDFYSRGKNRGGVREQCKACHAEIYRSYRKTVSERGKRDRIENPRKYKDRNLRNSFGITIEHYESLLAAQAGSCAICKLPERAIDPKNNRPKMLAVDHCHTTGKVRGLLCATCNIALGAFYDNSAFLQAAIRYLEAA